MNIYKVIASLLLVVTYTFVCTTIGISQDIVRVETENAEIHLQPESTESSFILAQQGDVFELERLKDDWVGVQMFSGKVRYLKMNQVKIVGDFFSMEVDAAKKINLCKDVQNIEDQAIEEANSKYPKDEKSADEYKNLLIDKDILNLFRNNNIPATHNLIFLECINDSLVPLFDS